MTQEQKIIRAKVGLLELAKQRGDPAPREMVQYRRDVGVAAVAYRDQQDTLGRHHKRQGGGQGSHGLRRTVPRNGDKSADFGRSLRRREQDRTAGSRQERFDGVAGGARRQRAMSAQARPDRRTGRALL